jgi:hypothetical protein
MDRATRRYGVTLFLYLTALVSRRAASDGERRFVQQRDASRADRHVEAWSCTSAGTFSCAATTMP